MGETAYLFIVISKLSYVVKIKGIFDNRHLTYNDWGEWHPVMILEASASDFIKAAVSLLDNIERDTEKHWIKGIDGYDELVKSWEEIEGRPERPKIVEMLPDIAGAGIVEVADKVNELVDVVNHLDGRISDTDNNLDTLSGNLRIFKNKFKPIG